MFRSQPILTEQSWLNPVWVVRGLPFAAMLSVAVALFTHSASLRDFCIGGALGLLVGFCLFSIQIKSVLLVDTPQPSDVNRYPIT
jgi:hypothetical protein